MEAKIQPGTVKEEETPDGTIDAQQLWKEEENIRKKAQTKPKRIRRRGKATKQKKIKVKEERFAFQQHGSLLP